MKTFFLAFTMTLFMVFVSCGSENVEQATDEVVTDTIGMEAIVADTVNVQLEFDTTIID